jgi:hypothetical protein
MQGPGNRAADWCSQIAVVLQSNGPGFESWVMSLLGDLGQDTSLLVASTWTDSHHTILKRTQ